MTTQEQVAAFYAANPTACIHDAREHAKTLPAAERDDLLNHWHSCVSGSGYSPTKPDEMFPRMPPVGSAVS